MHEASDDMTACYEIHDPLKLICCRPRPHPLPQDPRCREAVQEAQQELGQPLSSILALARRALCSLLYSAAQALLLSLW